MNDTLFYLNQIQQSGWKGFFTSYNMIFLWHVPSLIYYMNYKLFGLNWMGWHIVFSALHSLNAWLIFIILGKLLSVANRKLSFLAAFLFLISPFQTEVVAWGGTLHYLLIVTFLLAGIIALINYLETKKSIHIVWYHLFFACSLSCFEQAFLFPVLFGLFAWSFTVKNDICVNLKEFSYKFLLINILFIAGYFVMTKLTYGIWIAHYGASTHAVFNPMSMYECLLNYTWKFLFFYRHLPAVFKNWYHLPVIINTVKVMVPLTVLILAWFAYRKKYYRSEFGISIILFFLMYVMMLVPVLNLDQSFTFEIQSDRYGYVASVFFYPFLVLVMYKLLDRPLFIGFVIAQILVSLWLLNGAVNLWHQSGEIAVNLIKNYPLRANQKSYILNLPDNFGGAYMLRNGLPEGLSVMHKEDYMKSLDIIAMVNVFSNKNETSVEKFNDSVYYVKCIKNGKWYYYKGHGAMDYSTESFSVDFDEWNTAYNLTIKRLPHDTTYLLLCEGDKWRVVDTLVPTSRYLQ
ncbi:MAG: hypothetical protein IPM95_05910 [Sphingobacteriales bacterium]|nr:hypothetical protein [Sphingobacteriales bacterium]